MNCSRSRVLASLAAFILFTALADRSTAQTPLGGNLSGSLPAGVYVTTGTITVPANQILTLSPGVIIKFTNGGHQLTVDGTLVALGTVGNAVVFTDDADDSVGGDTNNNGPSSGVAAAWRGIVFSSTASASLLTYADVRFGGSAFVPNIVLNSCNATFDHCVSRNNYVQGMQLNGASFPTVTNCAFFDNGQLAVDGVALAAVPGFANNIASGNAGNYLHVTGGAVAANLTIGPSSLINNALMVTASIVIDPAATLTLAAGVIIKFTAAYEVTVNGTLLTNGTPGNPVILTDDADDSAGGDTNNNGASAGVAAAWRGIVFAPAASGSVLTYADVRYGGSAFVPNIVLTDCNATFDHCVSRNNYAHGMQLNGNSFPTVTNCAFIGNGQLAVEGVALAAVPGFANNTASGNAGNYLHITVGAVVANLAIAPVSLINGALMVTTSIVIDAGATLSLAAGVIIKFTAAYEVTANGTLLANGTAGNPVIFTAAADDSAGGDTNNNGASAGVAAAWRGIVCAATASNSVLTYAEVRYGGSAYVANVTLNSCNATLNGCVSRNNYAHGMQLSGNSFPTVTNCAFDDNGDTAVEGVALTAVPGFTNNTAAGNARNYMHVTTANVTSTLRLGAQSVLNGALVMTANLAVQPTGTLVVDQGVNFKFTAAYEVIVDGAVDLRGTSYEPVVFTVVADDAVAGDTNNNGPSIGAPGAWRGFTILAGASAATLENVVIRYPGSAYVPGLTSASPNVTLRAVRVDRAFDRGFVLGALAANPVNLVAWSCGGYGIDLTGGSWDLVHATAAANGTGIRRETAYTGRVVNSISYGNTTNYSNFTSAQVFTSDGGFFGSNGNLNVDPLFVDQATGDLHLTAASPVLGAADLLPALFVLKDHDENSRMLDHALIGLPLPDMGAFELAAWDMTTVGVGKLGSLITYTVTGQPGFSFYLFGVLDGVIPVIPYGIALAGGSVSLINQAPVLVGNPFVLPVPPIPGLVGLEFGIQSLTFPLSGVAVGNFTRLNRILVRP